MGLGLGSITKAIGFGGKAAIKENATQMAGGAAIGAGYLLITKWSYLDTAIKRGIAAGVIGMVGGGLMKKVGFGQFAKGVPGAAGAIIGMQILSALTRGGVQGLAADGQVYDQDPYTLSDSQVEERRLSQGGAFADADVDEHPTVNGLLASIVG